MHFPDAVIMSTQIETVRPARHADTPDAAANADAPNRLAVAAGAAILAAGPFW
jgi:hypothetical protein